MVTPPKEPRVPRARDWSFERCATSARTWAPGRTIRPSADCRGEFDARHPDVLLGMGAAYDPLAAVTGVGRWGRDRVGPSRRRSAGQ
jgi:hypothetical protein